MAGDVYAVHDGTVKWLHTQFSHLVLHGEPEVQAEKNKSETTHTKKKGRLISAARLAENW